MDQGESLIHTNAKRVSTSSNSHKLKKKVESRWKFYYGLKQGALQGGKTNKVDQPASLDAADGDDNDNIDVNKCHFLLVSTFHKYPKH